jgi:transcriptional regulator with PAS, ATPase and Fis domain
LFTIADGGTVFLDEIGDISPALQVRLLRVLQDREVLPLGAERSVPVNVRIIAATNKQLSDLVKKEQFREDLFYRIRVVHITLPNLKDRREDIPLLIDHLISKFNKLQGRDIAGVSMDVLSRLMTHDFPGNVRELENIIEQAFVLCRDSIIELHHLPAEMRPETGLEEPLGSLNLKTMEKHLITTALQLRRGNRKLAADDLGINIVTLYRKIKAMQIEVPETDGRSKKESTATR